MRCPSCNSLDTQVKDSRPTEDSAVIRRRRVCIACNFRFTTFERVQLRELTVIKRNGRRVPFDRDKLVRSLQISLRKRPVDPERVEKMVSAIVRELESGGEAEVSSEAIGEIVMEHLRQLDDVAYVRFASVYRNFREAKDFEAVLGELSARRRRAGRHVAQMIFRILEDQYAQKSKEAKAADQRFMQLALSLGRRGLGRTWPNPAVGAVVVKDGVIVGRGWTQPGGRPHAEPEALRRAGEAARGATLYVTLEPCSHFGKSPPCVDAVIASGIARVVSAIEDPNPEVAGQGHAKLRAAGIAVDVGLGAAEAAHDHAGHFRRIRDKRPHVILKLAVSADDKIGAAGHKPVAITGEAARTRVHLLRAQCDAILVGIGTVLADDPVLTCRLPGMEARSPVRVVLDRALRLPGDSKLVHSARQTPLWVMTSDFAEAPAAMKLGAAGAQVIRVAATAQPPGLDLPAVLHALSDKGITRLMVEGGVAGGRRPLSPAAWSTKSGCCAGLRRSGPTAFPRWTHCRCRLSPGRPRFKTRASESLGKDTLTIYERA